MFIHIGGDIVVKSKDVIAILGVNQLEFQNDELPVFENSSEHHQLVKITSNKFKSIIITPDKIYYSPISSLTLKKRAFLYRKDNILSE